MAASHTAIRWLACVLCLSLPHWAAGQQQNVIGGNGGTAFTLQCPSSRFAAGIGVRHDGNVINQIRLRCVAASASGGWAGSAAWTGWSPTQRLEGTAGLRAASVSCPQDQFIDLPIHGYTGNVGLATVVSGLRVRCVAFTSTGGGTSTQGTSQATYGEYRRIGARFQGTRYVAGQGCGPSCGIRQLNLKYGLAVDRLSVSALAMPWGSGAPRPALPVAPRTTRIAPAPRAAGQPDLTVRLLDPLWRYTGRTNHLGTTYRKVPEQFCASGMTRREGGRYSTKDFTLAGIRYEVRNAGSAATNAGFDVRHSLGGGVESRTSPALQPGRAQTITIARPARVRRCVTLGRVPGGCHECAGLSAYQDPAVSISVDTANAIPEADERNNELRQ